MKLTVSQRSALWGMFGGRCAYCGCELPTHGWHADHIEPVLRDGHWVAVENHPKGWSHVMKQTGAMRNPENERINNFFPSCRACNIDKSSYSLEDWRKVLEERVGVLRRNYSAFRHAERFGLVAQVAMKVVFYFERVGGAQ